MSVIIFPGQGAQYKGMGAELFQQFPELVATADNILGYSIETLCLENPDNCLAQTEYTQPALYTVNALHYFSHLDNANQPEYLAGHSLGEYNALLASGAFNFETGLKLVQLRGRLMSQAKGGAMLAIVRVNEQQLKIVLQNHQLDDIDIANYNSPSQFVISGSVEKINQAKQVFEKEKILAIPLKVSGAFHSRYMQEIALEFQQFLNSFEFNSLSIPVISNVTARPYENDIKQLLVQQISHSVKWTESIQYLLAKNETDFKEVGPGKVLSKLNLDIVKNAKPLVLTEEIKKVPEIKHKNQNNNLTPQQKRAMQLGAKKFKQDYMVDYAYVAGGMCHGISSVELVVKMAKVGMLAYFGTHGLSLERVDREIDRIEQALNTSQANVYGVNLTCVDSNPQRQVELVELFIRKNVKNIEVSGFTQITSELVKFRLLGLTENVDGDVIRNHKILLKTARADIAQSFMQPAPDYLVEKLLADKEITPHQAALAKKVFIVDDVCVEGDPGWRSSQAVNMINLPEVIRLRKVQMEKYQPQLHMSFSPRVGSAGGIGTPEAMAAVFSLGADFVMTGSINQCSVEASVSDKVKNILQSLSPQDTCHVPAGEVFESGAKVQVVRKNSFFPSRAQKLYDLYRLYNSTDELDKNTKQQIETHFLGETFENVYQVIEQSGIVSREAIQQAEKSSKAKMALIFKYYFEQSIQNTLQENIGVQAKHSNDNYQIYCSQAQGAFNQWVKGTELENWESRHVDKIAQHLLQSASKLLLPEASVNTIQAA